MPDYTNESCAGCLFFFTKTDGADICKDVEMSRDDGWPNRDDRCTEFEPSLECRQVRALEKLANCVRANDAYGLHFFAIGERHE